MVEWLTPALSCSDGYLEVLYDTSLPDKVLECLRAEAGIER
jgi:hypothetical protein